VFVGWHIAARNTASASSRIQVAVLPLARYDTTADVVPEALADAVTDGLIAELARHPAVEVTSRTSVMPFRERRVPLSTIASTLGVDAVVEGRVQVTGSRLWVEVRLVDAKRDRKVWVDEFAGDTSDRRELERRVAAALVRVLESRFGTGVTVE
jgi:TolB-like protein